MKDMSLREGLLGVAADPLRATVLTDVFLIVARRLPLGARSLVIPTGVISYCFS